MSAERVLLLFDEGHPCWNRALVADTGEDPDELAALAAEGVLLPAGDGFSLSDAGRVLFRCLAAECFLEACPGDYPSDPTRALARTRLERLLRGRILGRWSAMEFHPGARLQLPFGLADDEIADVADGAPRRPNRQHPDVKEFLDIFPPSDVPAPSQAERFFKWRSSRELSEGALEADLLFLSRYDYWVYMRFASIPGDTLQLADSDRFFFRLVPPGIRHMLDRSTAVELGRFALFLLGQRRVFLPGLFDRDREEQDSVSWWMLTTEREEDARSLAEALAPIGELLVPEKPAEVWTLSMEALLTPDGREESLWDLFSALAHPVVRME